MSQQKLSSEMDVEKGPESEIFVQIHCYKLSDARDGSIKPL